MDASLLEKLVMSATAKITRAQYRVCCVQDVCRPGLVNAEGRKALADARFELNSAYIELITASEQIVRATGMLAEYLEGPHV